MQLKSWFFLLIFKKSLFILQRKGAQQLLGGNSSSRHTFCNILDFHSVHNFTLGINGTWNTSFLDSPHFRIFTSNPLEMDIHNQLNLNLSLLQISQSEEGLLL